MDHLYLIALGSNQRHHRHGSPRRVLAAAVERLDSKGVTVEQTSLIIESAPLGPSLRRYANGAVLLKSRMDPPDMLGHLHDIERQFGRRRSGQRWSARVLDLDLVLWSGGIWTSPGLTIPHPKFRNRGFVLGPARALAADWRDPRTGLTLNHLSNRLRRRLTRPQSLP